MGSRNKNPPPDPALVQAQIQSLGYQDRAIQQFMSHADMMMPLQMEQMRWGLDTSRQAWNMAMEDRATAADLRNRMLALSDELGKDRELFMEDRARMLEDRQAALEDREWAKVGRGQLRDMQNQLINEAREFNTEQRREELAGQARADVAQSFGLARAANTRQMQRMGVNPNDGRSLAMGNQMAMAEAAANANAANKTRQAARAEGIAMTDRAYNALAASNYPGLVAQGLGMAGDFSKGAMGAASAASGALGNKMQGLSGALATLSSGMQANAMGAGFGTNGLNLTNQALSGLNSSWNMAGNMAGNMGNNATSMWNAQANYHMQGNQGRGLLGSAVGGLIGRAVGGFGIFSDRRLKTGIARVGRDEATGLNLYQFHYRDDPDKTEYIGVMADEVAQVRPDAVYENEDGFLMVDYDKLGIEMKEVA